ncbi:kelch-like protein 30 isoform X3 [Columba livia]|uniref:kelch-like protein 30 isoform X3 n=1 Tax=Columba livia TaxID=8932 RepID=UPI0031BA4D53
MELGRSMPADLKLHKPSQRARIPASFFTHPDGVAEPADTSGLDPAETDADSLVPTHDEQGHLIPEWKRQVMVRRLQARLADEEAMGTQDEGSWHFSSSRQALLGPFGELLTEADLQQLEWAVESLRLRRRGEVYQGELRRLARELRALLPAPLLSITVRSPPPAPGLPLPLWCGRLAGAVSSLTALLAHAEGARPGSPAAAAAVPPAAAHGQPREPTGSLAQREIRQCGVCVRSLRGAFEPAWRAASGKAAGGSGVEAASDSGISCEEAFSDGGGSTVPGPEWSSLRKERIVMLFLSHWRRSAYGPAPTAAGDPRETAGTGDGAAARLARQRAAIQRLLGGWRDAASRRPPPPPPPAAACAPLSPEQFVARPGGGAADYDSLSLELFMLGYFRILEQELPPEERRGRHLLCFEVFEQLGRHGWRAVRSFHRAVTDEIAAGRRGWLDGFDDIKARDTLAKLRLGSVCQQVSTAIPSSMVRNVDDFDFCLPSHAQGVLEGLQRLRANPKLADVTLLAGGREFPCHRSVLALCSHYFHAMFSGDFAESIAARVELKEVDSSALEMLLDFAYTGKVTINQGNVEGLMRTASQLHFPTIQKVCSRYLRQQMDATNCLGICEFGESHGCPEVSSKAWAFLQENFEAVSQQEEFLQLSKERLATYLSNKQLQVQEEQSLAEAVLRWVRHDPGPRAQFLPELLELSHLVSLPDQYLQNLLATEPLVRDSDASKALVARSCTRGQRDAGAQNPPSPPQKLEEVLVVVGGRVLEESEDEDGGLRMPAAPRNFAFYNPKSRQWMALPDFPDYNKWGFSLVALNNDVYVTGGSRGSQNDTWSTTQAWCFCLRDGAWKPIAPMLRARTNHTSAVLNGEIYVIGDLWSVITSPFIPKYLSAPRCATLHGLIYLIGDNTKKVYVYSPEANIWQKVQLLHTLHENGGMVPLGERLFVTGGHWKGMDGDYRVEMEVYDCAKDLWTWEGSLPCLWLFHSSSSIFMDTSKWTEAFQGDHRW